jgi:hypothetical protein
LLDQYLNAVAAHDPLAAPLSVGFRETEKAMVRRPESGPGPAGGQQANAAYNDVDYLIAHPPAERVIPKGERVSRADLIAITNSYFDGLSPRDGTIIIAKPGCVRIENGRLTTQRDLPGGGSSDCTSNGAMANIFAVTARRYPIVDEEAGVVLGLVLFERKPGVAMRRKLLLKRTKRAHQRPLRF